MTVGSDEGPMRAIALPIVILMLTATFAGCVGGDPDGDDSSGIDMDALNQMIDDHLQDFINNTSVEVTNNYWTNETVYNTYNQGNGSTSANLFTTHGSEEGEWNLNMNVEDYYRLLINSDHFEPDNTDISDLNGVNICVLIGSDMESALIDFFSAVSENFSFTTINSENMAQSRESFLDGSCSAMIGSSQSVQTTENILYGLGWLDTDDYWILAHDFPGAETYFDNWANLEIEIHQSEGEMIRFREVYAVIELTGTCVLDCDNEYSDDYSNQFIITIAVNNIVTFQGVPGPTGSGFGIMVVCSNGMEDYLSNLYYSDNENFAPGVECLYTVSFHASFVAYAGIIIQHYAENYEFEWSDWTYYVHWSSQPVTIVE